jgi:hypothetical protein
MTDAAHISMTPQELAALVDARIAERDARLEHDTEQARAVVASPEGPNVYLTPPRNPEFEAELLTFLDAENGDPARAAQRVLLSVNGTPPSQPLARLFDEWAKPFGSFAVGLLVTYLGNLKAKPERDARRDHELAGA